MGVRQLGMRACFAISCCTIGIGHHSARSQWVAAGAPFKQSPVQQVVSSPDGTRTYYCSRLALDSGNWSYDNSILEYANGQWDTIGSFPASLIYSVVEYHDTLLIASGYQLINDGSTDVRIAYWNGSEWSAYGSVPSGAIRRLRVLDDTLYAVGSMDSLDGQYVHGAAKRVGGTWQPVGQPIADPYGGFLDAVIHQGRLVAIGNAQLPDGRGVYRLEDGTWTLLGGGIEGNLCSAQSIAVLDDVLYIGGQITIACGNIGQGIMRLVNDEWEGVDLGLETDLGNTNSFAGASCMTVHDGLLWAGGIFHYAGGVVAKGLATWNGSQWCGVPGNFSEGAGHNGVYRMDFYYDTLFVAANMVDGDSVNYAAKFIGESYAGPCGSNVQVPEQNIAPGHGLFPNPATSTLHFDPPVVKRDLARITDALGREVLHLAGPVSELDVSSWPRGVYILRSGALPPARFVLQ